VALGWPWGGSVLHSIWPVGGFRVALGWPWVALRNLCSDFSFQLAAFQLLPKCGSGTSLSDFSFQHFSISAFAKGWLCAALFPISAFSFQHSSFCPIVALGGFTRGAAWPRQSDRSASNRIGMVASPSKPPPAVGFGSGRAGRRLSECRSKTSRCGWNGR
jgi:hypothetical protein